MYSPLSNRSSRYTSATATEAREERRRRARDNFILVDFVSREEERERETGES